MTKARRLSTNVLRTGEWKMLPFYRPLRLGMSLL
jgi:hypothetical protein